MKELIPVQKQVIGSEKLDSVDARELHAFLGVKSRFNDWIDRRIKEYGFIHDVDFYSNLSKQNKEYVISIDMAKELAMVEKTEKGKEARQYFIQVEKKARQLYEQGITTDQPAPIENSMIAVKYASEIMRWSETSRLRAMDTVCQEHGVSTNFLPDYTDEALTVAMGDLLKAHGSKLSARAANVILLDMGYLEEKQRRSSSGSTKAFKAITEAGLKYGKNETSKQSPNQTQPRYYEAKFPELLREIEAYVARNNAA